MATINIGSLSLSSHKGDYDNSTAYVKNDVVYYATTGSAYIAKQATTGNLPTSTAHWNVFAAGSGGIWNAGLSLGSANQVVRVNSGGNALEFGSVDAGSHTKIAEFTNSTGGVNTWALDNIFTSTYDFYMIYLTNYGHVDNNRPVHFRFRTGGSSGSDDSGSNYRYMYYHTWRDSGSEPTSADGSWDNTYGKIVSQDISGSSTDWNSFWTLYIHQPYQSKRTTLRHSGLIEGGSGTRIGWAEGATIYNGNTSHTGISFTAQDHSSGVRAGNKAYVYGIKY